MFETWAGDHARAPVRRARLLSTLALWFLLGLVGLVMVALTAPQEEGTQIDQRLSIAVGGIAAGLVLTYALSRTRALAAAITIFEVVLNAALAAVLATLGSFGPVLAWVPFVVLATAVLWSRRAAVWLTLLWSVGYLVTALAEQGGWEPVLLQSGQVFPAAVSIWLGILGFGLIGALAWLWVARPPQVTEPSPGSTEPEGTMASSQDEMPPGGGQAEPRRERSEPQAPGPAPLPIVPLFHGTVVLPVSGEIDAALGEQLLSELFRGIVEHDAQFVLLDVTRVPLVHQEAAHSLARVVAGAALMGAEVALVGIGPRLASRLVDLDVNLQGATTHMDMESALRYALFRLGRISKLRLTAGTTIAPPVRRLESGSTTES